MVFISPDHKAGYLWGGGYIGEGWLTNARRQIPEMDFDGPKVMESQKEKVDSLSGWWFQPI